MTEHLNIKLLIYPTVINLTGEKIEEQEKNIEITSYSWHMGQKDA